MLTRLFETPNGNNTWELVPSSSDRTIIGGKLAFRPKHNLEGIISIFKTQLVIKGFTQLPGHDYTKTCSPMVKPVAVKIVLCLAAAHQWPLYQFHVNSAFLQGELHEEVFMK